MLTVYTTPCLYSVDCIRPPDILPSKISPIVNDRLVSTANPKNKLSKSLFKMNDCDVSCWIAMSPASAPSRDVLSAWLATVKTWKGLRAGIWSIDILPESVNSTSALGTALVEYGLLM